MLKGIKYWKKEFKATQKVIAAIYLGEPSDGLVKKLESFYFLIR